MCTPRSGTVRTCVNQRDRTAHLIQISNTPLSHAFQRRAGEKEVREPHRRGRAPGNPAVLAGGTGDLDPYLLTATQTTQFPIDSGRLTEPVSTPFVTYPGLYSASCDQGGGATWLQVTSLAGTSRVRPVVNDDTEGQLGGTGPAWGYHGYERTARTWP